MVHARCDITPQRCRTANFALQRTFGFTPLDLAFCFFVIHATLHLAPIHPSPGGTTPRDGGQWVELTISSPSSCLGAENHQAGRRHPDGMGWVVDPKRVNFLLQLSIDTPPSLDPSDVPPIPCSYRHLSYYPSERAAPSSQRQCPRIDIDEADAWPVTQRHRRGCVGGCFQLRGSSQRTTALGM